MAKSKNRNRAYSNDEITVIWQPSQCTHSTLCYNRLRSVFDPLKRPWVNMNGASNEKILEIVEACPSMALTFRWRDEKRNENERSQKLFQGSINDLLGLETLQKDEAAADVKIPCKATVSIRLNGPIVISGEFSTTNEKGEQIGTWKMLSLCRCGFSNSMPHCDGKHFKVGFKSE